VKKILHEPDHGSIGVITFNAPQMDLIEDMLDQEKARDVDFRARLTAEETRRENEVVDAGFFVKNIENVQGDERDIIIFCIGYAPNETGRVVTHFGSLSQDGGENRLNVAVSRAKSKIYVVTSIEPEELPVSQSRHRGPRLFRQYLEYVRAVAGGQTQETERILHQLLDAPAANGKPQELESPLEEEIYERLLAAGLTNITTQQPVGGFRIDLVINDEQGRALLGIECDGAAFHASASAREADYHRQKYLESRGWRILRIWSADWWRDPAGQIARVQAALADTRARQTAG